MNIPIEIEIRDDQGKTEFTATVHLSEEITRQALIQIMRRQYYFVMGDAEYNVLVAWINQRPQDKLISEGSRVILQRKPPKQLLHGIAKKQTAKRNSKLAGDSTSDAPPPLPKK